MVAGRGEAGDVGDDAAADGDDDVSPGQSGGSEAPAQLLDRAERLRRLTGADRELDLLDTGGDRDVHARLRDHRHARAPDGMTDPSRWRAPVRRRPRRGVRASATPIRRWMAWSTAVTVASASKVSTSTISSATAS